MTNILNNKCEGNESSRNRQGKRMLADRETCKIELKSVINQLFATFNEALNKASSLLQQFPVASRSRTLEAAIVQSCFAECLFGHFPENAKFGNYKRIILLIKGYLILFKKLNKKGYPMNIRTQNVQSILCQSQNIDMFGGNNSSDAPILYFGYQKNRIGGYENPQLVYIDDGRIIFNISENDQLSLGFTEESGAPDTPTGVVPTLKNKDRRKVN